MAKKDAWKRYLEAGTAFTQITRARAEDMVQDLVKSGVLQRKEAQARVEELLERSRQGSEALLNLVRDEVTTQLHAVGIASVEDLARQVASMLGRTPAASATKTAAKRTVATKTAAKKTAAKKTAAKRTVAKKTAAKKAPATKTAAAKTAAKRTVAKKTAAKKPAAKRAVAKKAPATRAPAPPVGTPD